MNNYTNRNNNINIYFREIHSNSSLTRDEEIELFGRIARGDQGTEVIVFNKMAKMAVAVAKTYTCNPELLEDLIQEANMGILTAIKKYDPALGYRFSSYVRWWMKANITVFLNQLGIVHPSNTRIPDLAKKIRETFYKENHREISEYELMDKLEDMGEVVTDTKVVTNVMVTYIDKCVDDEDITKSEMGVFANRTASHNAFEDEIEQESLMDEISRRLSVLTPREQFIIRMKFGFITGYEMDYKSIAEEWNKTHSEKEQLTQERIRQICVAALKKMK